jgi:hypothetical protein
MRFIYKLSFTDLGDEAPDASDDFYDEFVIAAKTAKEARNVAALYSVNDDLHRRHTRMNWRDPSLVKASKVGVYTGRRATPHVILASGRFH